MQLNPHYAELNESYLFSTIAHKVADYQKAHPDADIIRLGIGDVTLPLAASVTEAMHRAVEEQGHKDTFHGYIPSEQGYEFLRDAIRSYYADHGVALDMSEIFVSDGAKSDLGNLLDLFSQDNTILVPDPVYPVYVDDNVMAGRKILYLPATAENHFLPMPDEAPHADIVYICSPNNPTGATYSVEQALAGGKLNKMWLRRQTTKFNGVAYVVQRGAEAVFTEEGMREIQQNLDYYRTNAAVIASALDEAGIWYCGGKNSPYLWLRCPNEMGSWEFFDWLLENAHVVGTPGEGFGPCGKGYFRLTAFGDAERTKEAAARIKAALAKL